MATRTMKALARSLSATGIVVGAVFFAASLTPSLLPRDFLLQGVLSGCSFAAGYLVGVLARWLWTYLELPAPSARIDAIALRAAIVLCLVIAVLFLWQASEWQNSIRVLMQLDPVEKGRPIEVGAIAVLVFAVILALARLVKSLFHVFAGRMRRRVPRRIANVLGVLIVGAVLWTAVDGLLFRGALRMADSSFQALDALIEADVARPDDPSRTGSVASLLDWEGLGRTGREYVASGPSAADIEAFAGQAAIDPIRVYVGLNSAETVAQRARLALEEMKRVGAFDRSVLVIVTPTGTGWIDPAAMDTLEYLHRGDVASVALQYSYLTSWLSLLFEPGYGAEAARALFKSVYEHWTTLPAESRPRLYLYGLSLGALNSDLSVDIYDVVGDPFHGALWSGPPFPSRTWRSVTAGRVEGTPAWLPRFRDGSIVRFANQYTGPVETGAPWGPIRIVYLQYASDPVTFFDAMSGYREPAWMAAPRGPDVSASLNWFPVVTLLQLALDMALATTTPMGHGHVYAPEHHVDPWIEVTEPEGWSPADIERLKAMLAARPRLGE
jgi:uncharacterized membrane protein